MKFSNLFSKIKLARRYNFKKVLIKKRYYKKVIIKMKNKINSNKKLNNK